MTALLDYRGLNSGELERIRQMLAQARAAKTKKGEFVMSLPSWIGIRVIGPWISR